MSEHRLPPPNPTPYQESGIGKIVGYAMFFAFLTLVPSFNEWWYPSFKTTTEEWGWSNEKFWMIMIPTNIWACLFFNCLIFLPLYYL